MVDIKTPSAASDDVLAVASVCKKLISCCEHLLSILQHEEDLVTLRLWSEGFKAGELLDIFAYSRDIELAVLRNLTILSNDIQKSITKQLTLRDQAQDIGNLLQTSLIEANGRLSRLQPETVSDEFDEFSSAEESDLSDTEDDSRFQFRIKLLMNLVPSMKRTLDAVKYEQHRQTVTAQLEPVIEPNQKTQFYDQPRATEATPLDIENIRLSNSNTLVTTEAVSLLAPTLTGQTKNDQSLPIIPVAPSNPKALRFRNLLLTLSATPLNYENPGLLDDALTHVPLERIYTEAEEEHGVFQAIAASAGHSKPEWGHQDCIMRSLLKWFKREFFEFVTSPKCSKCRRDTLTRGYSSPTPLEAAHGVNKVEVYECPRDGHFERFPRYSTVWKLLETRKGRAGEFANCFTMLCRAAGSRVRWVWNSEDCVWTEIYSEHRRRWIHVDPCEEIWDNPKIYTEGWGRKLAYCIAFSISGATDVTRRYVRDPTHHGCPRDRASEEEVLWIMLEIRKIRRENMEKDERRKLMRADEKEEAELQRFILDASKKRRQVVITQDQNQQASVKSKLTDEDIEGAAGDNKEAEKRRLAIQAATHAMGRAS